MAFCDQILLNMVILCQIKTERFQRSQGEVPPDKIASIQSTKEIVTIINLCFFL